MKKYSQWYVLAVILLLVVWGSLQLRTHVLDLERQAVAQQNKDKEAKAVKQAQEAQAQADKAAAEEAAAAKAQLEARQNNYSLNNLIAHFNQVRLATGQPLTAELVAEYFSELRLAELGLTEEARILIDSEGNYQGARPDQLTGEPYLIQVDTTVDGHPVYKDLMSDEATTVAEARATLMSLISP